jgi:hypothetical protein
MDLPATTSRLRSIWYSCLFGLAFVVSALPAIAAESVSVRGGVHPGYVRIVFDWARNVGFVASVNNRMLNVRFDRPLDPNFGNIRQSLREYLRDIRLASDGRTVLVGLTADYDVKTIKSGNRVVVDLVRVNRLQSDPAPKTKLPVKTLAAKKTAKATAKPPLRLGPKIPGGAASKNVTRPGPQKANSANEFVRVRTGHRKNYGRLVFDWSRKVGFTVVRKGQAVRLRFDAPGKVDAVALRNNLPSQISAALARKNGSDLELSFVVAPDAQLRYFHNGSSVVFDVVAPGVTQQAAKTPTTKQDIVGTLNPKQGSSADKSAKQVRKKKKREQVRALNLISVDATRRGAEIAIRFNWRKPVGATAFYRNGALWIVFDRAARIDLGAIKVVGGALFKSVQQVIGPEHVQIRLPFSAGLKASVRKEGTVWVLAAGPGSKRPPKALTFEVRRSVGYGLEFLVRTPDTGRIIVTRDKAVGDAAYAVPLKSIGVGIREKHLFPEFELASSPQGLAIRTLDDSVRVRTDKDGVVIFRKGGLTISPDFVRRAKLAGGKRSKRLLDLAAWRYGRADDFKKIEHQLLALVSKPKGGQRTAARMGLARFYAAYGLGPESLGVIAALLRSNPGLIRDPSVRALRGIANYFTGHFPEAEADLGHTSLAGMRDLYPWRAAIAAVRGDWAGAKRLFEDTDGIIAGQPREFARHLGLIATEAALSLNATASAEARLRALEGLSARGGELDQIAYLKGHVHKQRKRPKKALAIWKSVIEHGDRSSRAKAAFATVNLQLEAGKIGEKAAINELEKLKFAWRNSVFEFDLLHKLGTLYASQESLRDALVTLRQAASLYQKIKGSQTLTEKMRSLFRRFYLDDEADKLRPVVALGLFNEFRELTPPGDDGDRMIRRLAERLVKVDLLNDAAKLYEYQVRFRIKGRKKAEIGTRLAELRLMERRPDAAILALDISKVEETDAPLAERRRYLRARALNEAGRSLDAINVIAKDFTDRFDLLRADIYWRARDWHKSSRVLALISSRYDPAALGNDEVEILLRRAVALGLAGDGKGMEFLRQRYGAAMEKSPRGAAFKAVAGRVANDVKDFAALAREAAEIDTFRGLLDSLNAKPITAAGGGGAS